MDKFWYECINLARAGKWDEILEVLETKPYLAFDIDEFGSSLLIEISNFAGSKDVLNRLIELGADVNHEAKTGDTAIGNVITAGSEYGLNSLNELRLLLNNGASVTNQAARGFPPLHWAILNNRLKHAEILLEFGANPLQGSYDLYPETAFDVAKRVLNNEAQLLLQKLKQ